MRPFLPFLLASLVSACMAEPPTPTPQSGADADMIPAESDGASSSSHAITASGPEYGPVRYDRDRAVQYARYYAEDPNPSVAYCMTKRAGLPSDCTNFVSQALRYGGLPMASTGDPDSGWWYSGSCDDSGSSRSWRQVNRLIYWLVVESHRGEFVPIERAEPGDLVFYKLPDDKLRCRDDFVFQHSTMITGFGELTGVPLVSYHSRDVRDIPWDWSMRESGFLGLGDACSHVVVHIRD